MKREVVVVKDAEDVEEEMAEETEEEVDVEEEEGEEEVLDGTSYNLSFHFISFHTCMHSLVFYPCFISHFH